MSLTSHLKQTESPVRHFFDEKLNNIAELQRHFREKAGPLVVPASTANAGTMGGATDWLLRFLVNPTPDVHLAFADAWLTGEHMTAAAANMVVMLGTLDPLTEARMPVPRRSSVMAGVGTVLAHERFLPASGIGPTPSFLGPTCGSTADPDLLARGCWALALLTEVFRAGPHVLRRGPLARLALSDSRFRTRTVVSAEDLLALAPSDAIEELTVLRRVLEGSLLPALSTRRGPWYLGPVFAGSVAVGGADADLIAAGLLVELKTTLGNRHSDGSRSSGISKLELFQVVAYALLDFEDWYHIDELAVFNARYGHLESWPLDALVREMSAGALDTAAAKAELRSVVGSLPEAQRRGREDRTLPLNVAVDDPDPAARRRLAAHPATPPADLQLLANDTDFLVRVATARNGATPVDTLAALAADPDYRLRKLVAFNASTTPELLARLAADSHQEVRWTVARHTGCPPAILERLTEDAHEVVRRLATENLRSSTVPDPISATPDKTSSSRRRPNRSGNYDAPAVQPASVPSRGRRRS